MSSISKILAVIPARGGSKGVPGKNIKPILKKPLIAYTILEAQKSKYIDRLVVSTDDIDIKNTAQKYQAEVIDRPKELAEDASPTEPVLMHAVSYLEEKENYFPNIVLLLQPTCPMGRTKHIDEAIEKFLNNSYDSLLSVVQSYKHRFEIEDERLIPVEKNRPRRQERKPVILENGVIYLSDVNLIKQGKIVGDNIGFYLMDHASSVNIDEPFDFILAEQLLINEQKNGN